MSANRGSAGDRTSGVGTGDERGLESAETPPGLVSAVVAYTDGPDRRTVYPPGLSSVERMSTWFTADDDAFLDVDEMR
ncbi:hypothetical protein N0B31_05500 [Salinirubellus salinus]|uniref:DUF7511 domain-containing protein n=1 Tax=Salinirubellus salinus TaxID=1364945 RepID=A0A9E7R4P5_9EURY|nr:hypothetical protein [Salinirubellus salinus]UWM55739.1 hypothetical protein N0B31_05500 [Salinirubellus salinus]